MGKRYAQPPVWPKRVAVIGLGFLLVAVTVALPLRLVGPEFRINEETAHDQQRPRIAYLGRGRSVVTWDESSRVFFRLVDGSEAIGSAVLVAAGRPSHSRPDVCALPKGRFVVTWGFNLSLVGPPRGILAQVFDRRGNAVTDQIQVGKGGSTDGPPRVSCQGEAGFVVTWIDSDQDSWGIFARIFKPSGEPARERFLVNTFEAGSQRQPAIAAFPYGGFVVVWQSRWQGTSWDVYLQRFQPDGTRLGAETRVNRDARGSQTSPAVAAAVQGSYAVFWEEFGRDGERYGVFGAVSDTRTGRFGPEFQVNAHTAGSQTAPQVSFGARGSLLVTWQDASGLDGSDHGIYARAFLAGGRAASTDQQVNTYSLSRQRRPAVAGIGPPNEFLVVWDSYLQDGSLEGVYGQVLASRLRQAQLP
ncbi:MAG: hypothetical protein ACE5EG_05025 [Thermoanaerobaculia bacterium]